MSGTEQRGVCAGGKKPTERSINRILKLFCKFQNPHSAAKILFRHAELKGAVCENRALRCPFIESRLLGMRNTG